MSTPYDRPGTYNPGTGEPLPPVAPSEPSEISAAIGQARAAQPAWAARPAGDRYDLCRKLARRIMENRKQVCEIMAAETGRTATEAFMSEVVYLMTAVDSAVRACEAATATVPVPLSFIEYPGKKACVEAVPRGVVGIIAPWNYPLSNFYKPLFPALLSGNTVVLKPSEFTPRTGQWLYEQCVAVFPTNVVKIIQGAGDVGQKLIQGVDAIVFTGSVPTGRKVALQAAERLIPSSVELGGKDAAIVLADCDLTRTVAGVGYWGFHNAGQNCAGIERVYVEAPIADAFVAQLGKLAAALRVPEDLGPLQNPRQLQIVEEHVADALAKGARLVAGGKPTGQGLGYAATVLDQCTAEMRIMREETFGPVLAVQRVPDAEQALALANDCAYGLGGSVWTKNTARGEQLVRRMEVGVAMVNNHAVSGTLPESAWTGMKDTGTGIAQSQFAYATFVRRRTVLVDTNKDPDAWWFPANADLAAFAEAAAQKSLGSFIVLPKLVGLISKRVKAIKALATQK